MRLPTAAFRAMAERITIGNVAPINVVGRISTANAARKRATVRNASDEGSDGYSATQIALMISRTNGVASALSPTPISTRPNTRSGDRSRPAKRPAV